MENLLGSRGGFEAVQEALEIVDAGCSAHRDLAAALLWPGFVNDVLGVTLELIAKLRSDRLWIAGNIAVQGRERGGLGGDLRVNVAEGLPRTDGDQAKRDAVEDAARAEEVADDSLGGGTSTLQRSS